MTKRILITGIVQGVGFRPACKRIADEMHLSGTVKNLGGKTEIVIKCDTRVTEDFLRRLASLLPKEARFDSVKIEDADEYLSDGFKIIPSSYSPDIMSEILPDIATCDTCLSELDDIGDRRHRHPFISCTACGPRYSIMKALPYDRETTFMNFPLCAKCQREYTDLFSRRLHAQTIACKDCGPKLSYLPESSADPIFSAVAAIKAGGVIAVKDIGGYHFCCEADNKNAVKNLRELKMREQKPFAVMFKNIDEIKKYAVVNEKEEELLLSSKRPIVLLYKLKDFNSDVSFGSGFVGAMLPSNPVQYMLLKSTGPLVMTSGNISGEPIITENGEMLKIYEENPLLDGVLYHNRTIATPLDDSIYYVIENKTHLARRGRGVVPESIHLEGNNNTVFATGGDLKSSFGLYKDNKAVLSQHFGDLDNEYCSETYDRALSHMQRLLNIKPDTVVTDMHPLYISAKKGQQYKSNSLITVQHHHAHIASVMAEHNLDKVLGFALDGTGFGTDKTVWGGEALICEGKGFKRVGHLRTIPLCGGDEVSKNAGESLACYLIAAGLPVPSYALKSDDAAVIGAAIKMGINTTPSSSCGRLFDAVSCLLGFGNYNHFEGQCAMSLENAADYALKKGAVPYPLELKLKNGVLDTVEFIKDIYTAKNKGIGVYSLSLGFHYALADGFAKIAREQNISDIALSGGCFNNRILTSYLRKRLESLGFSVYLNEKVPCGDGGIALGQIYIATRKD